MSKANKAAFALTTEINGVEWNLLRHHHLDTVRDGTEHDTVNRELLTMALRTVDQLPVSDGEKKSVREHLEAHAEAIRAEMDEDRARALVESHNDGAPDGNHTITNPKIDCEQPDDAGGTVSRKGNEGADAATIKETTTDDSIVLPSEGGTDGGPSEKAKPGKDNSPAGVKGDLESEKDIAVTDDVEKKGGKGEPAHAPKVSEPPADTDVPTVQEGDSVNVGRKSDTQAGAAKKGTPTAPGKDNSPDNVQPDKQIVKHVAPKGADVEVKDGDGKNPDKPKVSETDEGKGVVPVVDKNEEVVVTNKGKSASESKKAAPKDEEDKDAEPKNGKDEKKPPKKAVGPKKDDKKKAAKKKTAKKGCDKAEEECDKEHESKAAVGDWVRNDDGDVGVITAVADNGRATVKIPSGRKPSAKGWKIIVKANKVNAENVLRQEMKILNSPEALMKFATPTPEGQRARNNAVALASVEDLTKAGKAFLRQRLDSAIAGKTVAKILGVETLGSVEFVDLKLGEKEDFPFYVMMEVHKDGENKVRGIKIFNERLPVETFNDLAKFLKDLAKEAPKKADAGAKPKNVKKTEAPAKLDRCVRDVMKKKVEDFRKKNKRAPNAKERKKMESSAFAICNAQLKKD